MFDDTMSPIYDDEYDIFSPPTIEYKVYCDYDMPPIYDDYNDYYECFTPTIPNETVYAYVESTNTFMLEAHERHALCDSYIVEFIHDATESYYERGKHRSKHFNIITFPLIKFKVLKLLLFYLPMLLALYFNDLFFYKIPMHRKWVRLKSVSYFSLDALFCISILIPM